MPNLDSLTGSKVPFLNWILHPFMEIKNMFTPMEDRWTWMAADGTIYEEVVILHVEKESVAFEHKYGFAAVGIANLSREVQKSLNEALGISSDDILAAHGQAA
jgi:hypothetical protein